MASCAGGIKLSCVACYQSIAPKNYSLLKCEQHGMHKKCYSHLSNKASSANTSPKCPICSVDDLELAQESPKKDRVKEEMCNVCNEFICVNVCLTCDLLKLCKYCTKAHLHLGKNHKAILLTDYEARQHETLEFSTRERICERHQELKVTYCLKCKEDLCSECLDGHLRCPLYSQRKVENVRNDRLNSLIMEVRKQLAFNREKKKKYAKKEKRWNNYRDELMKEIDDEFEKLYKALEQRKSQMKEFIMKVISEQEKEVATCCRFLDKAEVELVEIVDDVKLAAKALSEKNDIHRNILTAFHFPKGMENECSFQKLVLNFDDMQVEYHKNDANTAEVMPNEPMDWFWFDFGSRVIKSAIYGSGTFYNSQSFAVKTDKLPTHEQVSKLLKWAVHNTQLSLTASNASVYCSWTTKPSQNADGAIVNVTFLKSTMSKIWPGHTLKPQQLAWYVIDQKHAVSIGSNFILISLLLSAKDFHQVNHLPCCLEVSTERVLRFVQEGSDGVARMNLSLMNSRVYSDEHGNFESQAFALNRVVNLEDDLFDLMENIWQETKLVDREHYRVMYAGRCCHDSTDGGWKYDKLKKFLNCCPVPNLVQFYIPLDQDVMKPFKNDFILIVLFSSKIKICDWLEEGRQLNTCDVEAIFEVARKMF